MAKNNNSKKGDLKMESLNKNVISRIEAEKIKPDSEVEVVGKRLLPIVAAGVLAILSGLAVYSVLRMLTFYGSFGSDEAGGFLLALSLTGATLLGVTLCAVAISKSDWGYKHRVGGIVALALAVVLAFGMVLMQGPVERFLDNAGITSRLRLDERMLNESAVYGKITKLNSDNLRIEIMGGGTLKIDLQKSTRIYPRGFKLSEGQAVAVLIDDEGAAKWIRVLPDDHPVGRDINL
jgi:hypothetical protein